MGRLPDGRRRMGMCLLQKTRPNLGTPALRWDVFCLVWACGIMGCYAEALGRFGDPNRIFGWVWSADNATA